MKFKKTISIILFGISAFLIYSYNSDIYENILYHVFPKSWYWQQESQTTRNKLPEFKTIPAAVESELSFSNKKLNLEYYKTWTRSHSNDESVRYSALNQINKSNVKNLKVAWVYKSKTKPGLIQSNPIIVGNRAFFPTTEDFFVAVNAKTGKEIWKIKTAKRPGQRGFTYWKGTKDIAPRIYFAAGTNLYAISPETGNFIKSFGVNGKAGEGRSTVSPVIAKGIIAYPVVSYSKKTKPMIQGLDVITGKLLWKKELLKISKEYERFGVKFSVQGANPWGGISADTQRGIVFVTTGDAQPTAVGTHRPGPNDYSNSLIAMDIQTGKILWSFQEVAHDLWDKDIPAPPIVTEITRNNKKVEVVIAVTKQGNTIILDRLSGKPIYPWRLRRAPVSPLFGEKTAPYQPDLEIPEPFSKQNFTVSDITNLNKDSHNYIKQIVEKSSIGFFPPPGEHKQNIFFNISGGAEWPGASVDPVSETLYVASSEFTQRMSVINTANFADETLNTSNGRKLYLKNCKGCHGKNREGSEFAPILYNISDNMNKDEVKSIISLGKRSMPSFNEMPSSDREDIANYLSNNGTSHVKKLGQIDIEDRYKYVSSGWRKLLDKDGFPGNKPPWGWLNALNLSTGKIKWRIPLGDHPDFLKKGIKNIGTQNLGAPVATAGGIVFCSGTTDQMIRAFDVDNGKELWKYKMPAYGGAAPTIYEIDHKQYILIPATGGFSTIRGAPSDTYIAFSLPD